MLDMSSAATPVSVACDAQSAFTAARLRLQQLHHRMGQGDIDIAHILTDLGEIDRHLGQGIDLVGSLQVVLIRASDSPPTV